MTKEQDPETQYEYFCAHIHFLDLEKIREERPSDMNIEVYNRVFEFLEKKGNLTQSDLVGLFEDHPEAIDVFEQLLQISNFTIAQRAYLMFDLKKLNSEKIDESLEYILELYSTDEFVKKYLEKHEVSLRGRSIDDLTDDDKISLLARSKRAIAEMCRSKGKKFLQKRIKRSGQVRERVSRYLLEKRKLNPLLKSIHPRAYIEQKQLQTDPKSAHGAYASEILRDILEKAGFEKRDNIGPCRDVRIPRTISGQGTLDGSSRFQYCTEKEVETLAESGRSISSESGAATKKTAKRFDFVLLYEGEPRVVIETNFYTTSGSKIGINQKEYVALYKKIKSEERGLRFIWVTDGNYWLTSTGKKSFLKLVTEFRNDLMNLWIFKEHIDEIKKWMQS